MRTIEYNGFILQELPNGCWDVCADGQSMRFDSLRHAIRRIDYWTK